MDRFENSITIIEWNMMDKNKFYPLSMASSFTIRCMLYPFTVIKTRIQVQKRKSYYHGTIDAFRKIWRYEGPQALYKGFWINSIQLLSGVMYVTTYENVRQFLGMYTNVTDSRMKALIGGGCASIVGQTIIVPFDIISQHMMVMGQKVTNVTESSKSDHIKISKDVKRLGLAWAISKELYSRDGIRGFYRGYFASLLCYVPNSAFWWSFYHFYAENLAFMSPSWVPHLMIQCVAAPMGGVTAALFTNPLDIIRARLQVQRIDSFFETLRILWAEEKLGIFTKGLSARLVQSITFSFCIILGYESVKRWSLKEEFKGQVRW